MLEESSPFFRNSSTIKIKTNKKSKKDLIKKVYEETSFLNRLEQSHHYSKFFMRESLEKVKTKKDTKYFDNYRRESFLSP